MLKKLKKELQQRKLYLLQHCGKNGWDTVISKAITEENINKTIEVVLDLATYLKNKINYDLNTDLFPGHNGFVNFEGGFTGSHISFWINVKKTKNNEWIINGDVSNIRRVFEIKDKIVIRLHLDNMTKEILKTIKNWGIDKGLNDNEFKVEFHLKHIDKKKDDLILETVI